jgi:predicted NUDIX family NTP pyrophosphohydrolase
MSKGTHSAGALLYRRASDGLEVLLVHPGGPYWRGKGVGAWQLPKGLIESDEDAAAAARREVEEELGIALTGEWLLLGSIRQAGGKTVEAFAVEQDVDCAAISSNLFELEWPPRSGKNEVFPEIDAARWMTLDEARNMMLASQRPLIDRLEALLAPAVPGANQSD